MKRSETLYQQTHAICAENVAIQEFPNPSKRNPRKLFEYLIGTGELWTINKPSLEPPWTSDPQPTLEEIQRVAKELSYRQNPISEHPSQVLHSKCIRFLYSNWGTIRDAIRPSVKENKIPPYRFYEVDFTQFGRADFIGIASDGSLVIIELGTTQKPSQVGRHSLGLSQISDNSLPIFPYVARFERERGNNLLTVDLSYSLIVNEKVPPPTHWKY